MKFHPSNLLQITLCFLVFIISYSCNKDSDLLAEYVIEKPQGILINDQIITMANSPVIIEPLKNDSFEEPEKVVVSEVTPPKMGTAEVQEDNTVVYTPDTDETGTDEFDYTTTITNPDETVTTQTGKITVTIEKEPVKEPTEISASLADLMKMFDTSWTSSDLKNNYGKALAKTYSTSENKFQEYYYLSYQLDGVIQAWQATGNNTYLNDALELIDDCISDAVKVQDGKYMGWKADAKYDTEYASNGISLWESYLWRHVATLLRIMHKSPNLRATGTYQAKYDEILNFTLKNIWEKWYTKTTAKSDIYRVNTHMSSHWARIAMELYLITGKQEYKTVFENISYAGMPNNGGKSLRDMLFNNTKVPTAYAWKQNWNSSSIQDTSHGADVISFFVNAAENGMYWDLNDMKALVSTLNDVVWTSNSPLKFTANVDGSGGSNTSDAGFHNFITLGRFDEALQLRIESYYDLKTAGYQKAQAFGIAALNRKILDDGYPVYPEQY